MAPDVHSFHQDECRSRDWVLQWRISKRHLSEILYEEIFTFCLISYIFLIRQIIAPMT